MAIVCFSTSAGGVKSVRPGFAQVVFDLKPGTWDGPVASGYGLHLVLVSHIAPAVPQGFAAACDDVLEAWRRDRQNPVESEVMARLREKYGVEIDAAVQARVGDDLLSVAQR